MNTSFEAMNTKFVGMDTKFEAMNTKFVGMEKKFVNLENSVAGEIGALHLQIVESEARMLKRWEQIDARLALQAGLIRDASVSMSRFIGWTESSESRWIQLVARVEAIEDRLRKKN
jgi:hypothetical protein